MAANQVIINGQTVLDLRSDTVTADKLLTGYTAHDKSGTKITGTAADSDAVIREAINSSYSGSGSTLRTITLTNIVANDGKGWFNAYRSNCTWKYSTDLPGDGVTSCVKVTPSAAGECTLQSAVAHSLVASHKYYLSFKVKFTSQSSDTFDWYWPIAEPSAMNHASASGDANTWIRISTVFTRTSFSDGDYRCRWDYNNDSGNNIPVLFTSCMLFDLTEAFGAGLEPTKEWLDEHITTFGDSLTVHYVENLEGLFSDIANAIRAKEGSSNEIYACDFANRIRNL